MSEVDVAIKLIPKLDVIFKQAIESLGLNKIPADEVSKNFEQLLEKLESTASNIYRKYEEKAFKNL